MKAAKYSLFIAATVAIASLGIAAEKKGASAAATEAEAHKVYDGANLEWGPPPPGFPAGAQVAVLYGNPGEKGVYTVRLKAPAGYKIMPHTHPTAELVTVISGGFHVGMGGKFDESAGEAMTAGGFVSLPAGMQHSPGPRKKSSFRFTERGRLRLTTLIPRTIRGTKKK
ncbi:MAG: cupin domain-containing protein [Chthoniobacterales bacterium]|nr:cupin domain-containing protein [Chthoniobacterales bacterium]